MSVVLHCVSGGRAIDGGRARGAIFAAECHVEYSRLIDV